jgi:hypothetical protein
MSETVFVRDAKFPAVEKEVRRILAEVDAGKHDEELTRAGIKRPAAKLAEAVEISQGQGLSPNEWLEIITVFGPLVATVAKDVWTIVVVPTLKRLFTEDSVSADNPDKN